MGHPVAEGFQGVLGYVKLKRFSPSSGVKVSDATLPRVRQAMRQYRGLEEDDVGDCCRLAPFPLGRLGERPEDLGGVTEVGRHPLSVCLLCDTVHVTQFSLVIVTHFTHLMNFDPSFLNPYLFQCFAFAPDWCQLDLY